PPSCTRSIPPRHPLKPPATTHTSTLSLHDALPISIGADGEGADAGGQRRRRAGAAAARRVRKAPGIAGDTGERRIAERLPAVFRDRKSTRLNSSHRTISYAVVCLKKKNHRSTGTCA